MHIAMQELLVPWQELTTSIDILDRNGERLPILKTLLCDILNDCSQIILPRKIPAIKGVLAKIKLLKKDCFCRQWDPQQEVRFRAIRTAPKYSIFHILSFLNWVQQTCLLSLISVSSFSHHIRLREFLIRMHDQGFSTCGHRSGGVYIIVSADSGHSYIGQTSRNIGHRFYR